MRILIITTYYPPDTTIAAVRPYMFAKYMAKRGHEVTVLRSGEFFDSASDYFDMTIPVRVISYLGENSPAERYARGELKTVKKAETESRISFLPEFVRKPVAKLYHGIMRPVEFKRWLGRIQDKFEIQKKAIDGLAGEHFDVVFSTYGQMENMYAGQYAAKVFGCKLIQDFRDSAAARIFRTGREYRILKKIQDQAVQGADGCTAVSEGLLREVTRGVTPERPSMVLYNGYEPTQQTGLAENADKDMLTLCYTGKIYGELSDMSALFRALRQHADAGKVDLEKIRLHYAGADFQAVLEKARKQGVDRILVDHGYVSRAEAERIQSLADLFLVLSWNTKESQGILTGKFYEGIRAEKPILAMVNGNVPGSELELLNRKYGYGLCYEASQDAKHFPALCDFLQNAYEKKMETGYVEFPFNPQIAEDFRYDILAKQLEEFCEKL